MLEMYFSPKMQVGILEGEGYSVNVPWKTGGVGDNDYLFAFQNIILPIGLFPF